MKNHLNVLYAADNNYAPFLGVSMFSLFLNNTDIEKITVYAVLDNVSDDNKSKLKIIADNFMREIVIVEADEFNNKISMLGIPSWRGNYTTNYRLFFDQIISNDVERLVYIDSDTIVTGSLKDILNEDLKNICAGVVLDCLARDYKMVVGIRSEEPYFNAGVLVINVLSWKQNKISDAIIDHVQNQRSKYCNPDQDLLNIALRGKIKVLPPEYNLTATHTAYSEKVYGKIYGWENYYTPEQIAYAKAHPVICHTYRFLGQFPWHKDNLHPDTKLFDEYLRQTLWADYEKQSSKNNSFIFKIERVLYRILPKMLFLFLFKEIQMITLKKQNKKLLKEVQNRRVMHSVKFNGGGGK